MSVPSLNFDRMQSTATAAKPPAMSFGSPRPGTAPAVTSSSRYSVTPRKETGLVNNPGDNNCFLNVILQSLFHIKSFGDKLLEEADKPHNCIAGCMLCGIATLFEDQQTDTIDAHQLRKTLAGTSRGEINFDIGGMSDAGEALETLLEKLHNISYPSSVTACKPDSCWIHHTLGTRITSTRRCDSCSHVPQPNSYWSNVMYLPASAIYRNKNGSANHFLSVFATCGAENTSYGTCDADQCKGKVTITELADHLPDVLVLNLVWKSRFAEISEIEGTAYQLQEKVAVNDLPVFSNVPSDHQWAQLLGFVCYYKGSHYVAYFKDEKGVWVYLDDSTVRPLTSDLLSAQLHVVRSQYQPCLLFYKTGAHPPVVSSSTGIRERPTTAVTTSATTTTSITTPAVERLRDRMSSTHIGERDQDVAKERVTSLRTNPSVNQYSLSDYDVNTLGRRRENGPLGDVRDPVPDGRGRMTSTTIERVKETTIDSDQNSYRRTTPTDTDKERVGLPSFTSYKTPTDNTILGRYQPVVRRTDPITATSKSDLVPDPDTDIEDIEQQLLQAAIRESEQRKKEEAAKSRYKDEERYSSQLAERGRREEAEKLRQKARDEERDRFRRQQETDRLCQRYYQRQREEELNRRIREVEIKNDPPPRNEYNRNNYYSAVDRIKREEPPRRAFSSGTSSRASYNPAAYATPASPLSPRSPLQTNYGNTSSSSRYSNYGSQTTSTSVYDRVYGSSTHASASSSLYGSSSDRLRQIRTPYSSSWL
eukprot:TRINITY_DN6588_c5_g1_i1.p1 TRINITY_DN6588_c5_g1~~TRINITY_DN6588_c5_g1_i1.p1  ORF type:complete len:762 (+),score=144.87 TRINITY_DN6588_c5_g1_i1:81-2366(+)